MGERDWRLDSSGVGVVRADRQRLTQAMLNLVRNAVEHTGVGAEVGLGSSLDGDGVRLWVRDTGPGVDERDRDQIFERFARGRGGRRRSDGAGLGLAIVRTVAEAHGGRVELGRANRATGDVHDRAALGPARARSLRSRCRSTAR